MQSPESSVVQVQALSAPAEAAETEGFGLYIDGVFIAARAMSARKSTLRSGRCFLCERPR